MIVIVVGLSITLIYLLYYYETDKKSPKKELKVRESVRQDDFECPRCGEHVDGETPRCYGCGAEFEMDTFLCPVCGIVVSRDEEECSECGEKFIVEERDFECPECGNPVDEYSNECKKCDARFWSPVKRSNSDIVKKEDEGPKKLDPSIIEILDE